MMFELHLQHQKPQQYMTLASALHNARGHVWFQIDMVIMQRRWFRWVEVRRTLISRDESRVVRRMLTPR